MSKSDLDPEGPPRVRQVLVLDPASTDDPVGGEYALIYGIHPDAWDCGVVDNDCPSFGDNCADTDTTNDAGCLVCETEGELEGHCVFTDATGEPLAGTTPGATSAIATGASIRIISKELLDGQTLEQFACACFGSVDDDETTAPCPAGGEWVIDPTNCSACGDNGETPINEGGRCLDVNNDLIPDLATLQAGVAVISCPGVTSFGTNGTYNTGQGDGYYYPSGNQLATSAFGYGGFGPGIVIEPLIALPTSTTCTVTLTDKPRDKDGNAFEGFPGASFDTEPLVFAAVSVDEEDVPLDTEEIEVAFSADIDEETVDAASVVLRAVGTVVAIGTVEKSGAGTVLITVPAGALDPETEYEIVIADTITDIYGQPIDSGETITFTTEAAAM